MKTTHFHPLDALVFALTLSGCGGGSDTMSPLRHDGMPAIAFGALSSNTIMLSDTPGQAALQNSPLVLALGLTAADKDVQNLELTADLFIGNEPVSYRLETSEKSGSPTLTVDEIKAGSDLNLTIPLYLTAPIIDRLRILDAATDCVVRINLDPANKQSKAAEGDKQRSLTLVYLPKNIFEVVAPSDTRRLPPYSKTWFKAEFDKNWGVEDIALLHVDYSAAATWEPIAISNTIPYAAALEGKSDVHATVLWNNLSIMKGGFYANGNLNSLSDSGYKVYYELLGKTLINKEEYYKAADMLWSPQIVGNIPSGVLPISHNFDIGGGVVVTVKAAVEGTYDIGMPGNLSLRSAPWILNQAFSPDVRAVMVSSVAMSNTRYGITAPVKLADVRLRAKLDTLKVNPGKVTVDANIEWPGDYTMLKGTVYITYDKKPKYKIYDWSILDQSTVMDQRGFLHGNSVGLQVDPGEYHDEARKW
ncbi:MAG: hypothetical protein ACOYNZ_09310 [Rhodoferax sp.]